MRGDERRARRAGPATVETGASPEELLAEYLRTGDRRFRNRVVEDHQWLASVIARDFRYGSEPFDDLVQVACVAILKAAERFDPTFGVAFRTYAAVTARGELRRHYRDAVRAIRVPRRLQELRYEIRTAVDTLTGQLRRSPTNRELAEHLAVTVDEIIDCQCADDNFRTQQLDENDALVRPGSANEVHAVIDMRDAFERLTTRLPHRERRVLEMRYVEELKQSDIAAALGISQVHVSRLLRSSHELLRLLLEQQQECDLAAT